MEKRRVFLDMDGVLCEYRPDSSVEDMTKDGYFRNLAPRSEMIDAVKYLLSRDVAEVFVLSAVIPEVKDSATADKNAWLNDYLPMIDKNHRIFTLCGASKAEAVNGVSEEDVLFDDYSANLTGWKAAGGSAVKILNEVNGKNGSFTAGPRIRVKNREDLITALKAV